jgi:PAS domain S-box-containing protein
MPQDNPTTLDQLTPREREVLTYVAKGLSLPEIAEKLHRSLKTIESHRLSLGRKLGASNRVELTRIAIGAGLAPIEVTLPEDLPGGGASGPAPSASRAELESRAQALQQFQTINDEVFSATGPTFLRRLVLALSRVLGKRIAMVCVLQIEDGKQIMNAMAICDGGAMMDPARYDLACTPCEDAMLRGRACYLDHVAEAFPEDTYLKQVGAVCYVGVRLDDQQGNPIGLLSVLDDRPLDDAQEIELILKMYAPRVAAELDQLKTSDRVRELTEDLETEVQKRTAELVRANAVVQSIVNRTTDGIGGVDADGNITYMNPRLAEMIGRPMADVIGQYNIVDLIHPDDRETFEQNHYKTTRQRSNTYRVRLLHADGSAVPCRINSHAHVDEDNEYLGCFAVLVRESDDAGSTGG